MSRTRRPRKKNYSVPILLSAIAVGCIALIAVGVWASRTSAASPAAAVVDDVESLLQVEGGDSGQSIYLEYPGFVMSFNPQAHQPNWVAWELTRDEALSTAYSRKDSQFAPDPQVAACATLADYRSSGYDRGHMAPAADMRWSQQAMDACHLLTNMCPQDHKLNGGAWKSLEEKCRDWALRDSAIVIVCGPVLTDRMMRTIGASQVPVPERFFKVILAPYADSPRAIGFIMNNGYVEGGMQPSAVSVDEVERVTGYDFFAALPDDIEQEVEAACNFPLWSQHKSR